MKKTELEKKKEIITSWKVGCKHYFGDTWSKRKTNRRDADGRSHLNPLFKTDINGNLHLK